MQLYERDFFISRVRAGYIPIKIDNKRMLIYSADQDVELEANEIYREEYQRGIDEDILADNDILNFLIINDLWSETKEKEYNEILPKHIDYWKKELYQAFLKTKTREKIRKYLQTAKDELVRLSNIRTAYNYATIEGYASYVKSMFIISESARIDGKKVDWDYFDLNSVMYKYHSSILSSGSIRMLARTSPWSGLWPVLKSNGRIFDNVNLSDEQQSLLSWSLMYDKIYESPDCPSDDIIHDDDMLDGWILVQKEERKKNMKQQEAKGALNEKVQNSDEVFIVAETKEDAEKVDALNSAQGQRIKQNRLKQLSKKGKLKQQEFKDVQLERSRQMKQAYTQRLKGK